VPAPNPQQRALPLWIAALWVVAGGLLAQVAGGLVSGMLRAALASRGQPAESLATEPLVLIPSMLASTGTLLAVACLAPLSQGLRPREALGLRRASPLVFVAAAVGTVMLGPTADLMMRAMEHALPDMTLGVVPLLNEVVATTPLLLAWPVFALMPGLSEELLFRGLLQRAAGRGVFAIVVSAVGFALFHVDPHHVAGVLPLGLFLAWVASRAGTLVTVVAHVVNNTAAIFAVRSETFDVGYGTAAPMPPSWVAVGLALTAVAAWLIVRETARDGEDTLLRSEAAPALSAHEE
jgi:membrane protease YdiL (CAAX protease family)